MINFTDHFVPLIVIHLGVGDKWGVCLGGQDNLNIKTGLYEIRRQQHCHLVVLLDWKINNKTKTAYNPATNYSKHCTYIFMFVYLYETVTRYHHH